MRPPRLALPLALSLSLHLGVAWMLSPGGAASPSRQAGPSKLTVHLTVAESSTVPAVAAPETTAPSEKRDSAAIPQDEGVLTEQARFLVAPDLAALEEIPAPFSGKFSLRLHVSTLGTVDRVTVLKGDRSRASSI